MRTAGVIAVLALAMLSGTSALAATESGLTPRRALQRVADCIVQGQESQALDIFMKESRRGEYQADNKLLLDRLPSCLNQEKAERVRMSNRQFDQVIAASLVRHFYGELDPGDLLRAPAFRRHGFSGMDADRLPSERSARTDTFRRHLDEVVSYFHGILAECVVRTDAAQSRRLLLSRADTNEEAQAFSALNDTLASCAPARSPLQLSTEMLRDWMGFYYLMLATSKTKGSA